MNDETYQTVLRAADFAATKHRDQRRKDHRESPYINHPIKVATLIVDIARVSDPQVLAAALLHDTIEDTDTSASEIRKHFGAHVAALVQEVSDDRRLNASERKRRQIESAPHLSLEAALIKLADKTSNIRDIIDSPPKGWSLERRFAYLDWAEAVIDGCPPVSPALERVFRDTLNECRQKLTTESATS